MMKMGYDIIASMLLKKIFPWGTSFFIAAGFSIGVFNAYLNQWIAYQSGKFILLSGLTLLMTPIFYLVWYRWAWRALDSISITTKIGWVVVSILISWVIYTIMLLFGLVPRSFPDNVSLSRRIVLMGLDVAGMFIIWLPVFLIGTWLGTRE